MMRGALLVLVSTVLLSACGPEVDGVDEASPEVAISQALLAEGAVEHSPPVRPTAGCHYTVIWPHAGVYEQPASNLLKVKILGDVVGDYCDWVEYASGNYWLAVVTASAEDGIGWMRRDALRKH